MKYEGPGWIILRICIIWLISTNVALVMFGEPNYFGRESIRKTEIELRVEMLRNGKDEVTGKNEKKVGVSGSENRVI